MEIIIGTGTGIGMNHWERKGVGSKKTFSLISSLNKLNQCYLPGFDDIQRVRIVCVNVTKPLRKTRDGFDVVFN